MRIVIQAFSNDEDTRNVEFRGDSVAEVKTFEEAHEAINDMEKSGI
jgi:hypothetical protein